MFCNSLPFAFTVCSFLSIVMYVYLPAEETQDHASNEVGYASMVCSLVRCPKDPCVFTRNHLLICN